MRLFQVLIFLCVFVFALGLSKQSPLKAAPEAVQAPVLKWAYGGCFSSWCQTGWYASPAIADLDNDGKSEVIWGSYDAVALNGEDGSLHWRAEDSNRVWPGVAVVDLTGDGSLEVIMGRNNDRVVVYNGAGETLWERNPFGSGEVRTLAVTDIDGDERAEIIVGRGSGGSTHQINVFDAAGNQRPGWPARRDGEAGFGWGMYNQNITVADLDNDGDKELIAPTDTHYITGLDHDGSQLAASPIYGAGKVWSEVGVHVDHAVDLRGYANCGTEHRPNFANMGPAISDLDGDGSLEIIVPGDVYNCAIGDNEEGDLYIMPWIFNLDRTRWGNSSFNWEALPPPEPNSRPLSEDYSVIENNVTNMVAADLDGDGVKELIYTAYDGRMHAYWLDKTQHGNWPYTVPGSGIRFAAEPVVVDIDNDGKAEVIFTSWPEKSGNRIGQLHILDYLGNELHRIDLPAPKSGGWNGGLAAPSVGNIDGDEDLEIVIGTVRSGVVAYDLPGSKDARVLWETGRGSYERTGFAPDLNDFYLSAVTTSASMRSGESVTFEVEITADRNFEGDVMIEAVANVTGFDVQLSKSTITPAETLMVTVEDQRTTLDAMPLAVEIILQATGTEKTKEQKLWVVVNGTDIFLPTIRSP